MSDDRTAAGGAAGSPLGAAEYHSRLVGVGRIVSGERVVLASPDWEGAAFDAGRLLRLYQRPLSCCVSEEQRQGWLAEDERICKVTQAPR